MEQPTGILDISLENLTIKVEEYAREWPLNDEMSVLGVADFVEPRLLKDFNYPLNSIEVLVIAQSVIAARKTMNLAELRERIQKAAESAELCDPVREPVHTGMASKEVVQKTIDSQTDWVTQELLKDKARLDWLADIKNNLGQVLLPAEVVTRNLHDMRAAIDEAMEMNTYEDNK